MTNDRQDAGPTNEIASSLHPRNGGMSKSDKKLGNQYTIVIGSEKARA